MFVKPNKTKKATANDVVMTNPDTAELIVKHFNPKGLCLDPCAGDGAFYNALPSPKLKCEISEGLDFFKFNDKVDWIITNPPFSIYDDFLLHAFEIANNVVYFVPLNKTFKSRKIEDKVVNFGGLKEVLMLGSGSQHGFPFGFQVGCLHYQRNYKGDIKLTRKY